MKNNLGFTLIELLTVVAVLGALASIAVPAFVKYVKQSKTTEAFIQLKSLGESAMQYYQVEHYDAVGFPAGAKMFPTLSGVVNDTSSSMLPLTVPVKGKVITPLGAWSVSPWVDMKYAISKAHYYQYQYSPDNTGVIDTFDASANGDLDGDGVTSTFRVVGEANWSGDSIYLTPVYVTTPSPIE